MPDSTTAPAHAQPAVSLHRCPVEGCRTIVVEEPVPDRREEPATPTGRVFLKALTTDSQPGRVRGRPIREWILAIEREAATPHVGHTPCCFIPSQHKWADPIRCLEDHEDWPCAVAERESQGEQPVPLDVERLADWLHENAATRRRITCGPDSTGCRTAHRLDAHDILARLSNQPSTEPAPDLEAVAIEIHEPGVIVETRDDADPTEEASDD